MTAGVLTRRLVRRRTARRCGSQQRAIGDLSERQFPPRAPQSKSIAGLSTALAMTAHVAISSLVERLRNIRPKDLSEKSVPVGTPPQIIDGAIAESW
jgi:hypothetical protein